MLLSSAPSPTKRVPPFTMRIVLSEEANKKLANAGETISGTIYFDGDGMPFPEESNAPMRDVFLGKHEFELRESGELVVSDASISDEAYNHLSDKNYHYTINVVSGRRVFPNNVLAGGYAAGRLRDLDPKRPIEIKCDLLEKE